MLRPTQRTHECKTMTGTIPSHMHPKHSFQGLILTLHNYWADYGCVVLQPYDMEVGAGTFHPATTLRALGPKPWNAAYVQPSRRPTFPQGIDNLGALLCTARHNTDAALHLRLSSPPSNQSQQDLRTLCCCSHDCCMRKQAQMGWARR